VECDCGPSGLRSCGLARRESRRSLTGEPLATPREWMRDTFVQRYDLAKHVGQGPRSQILSTAEGASVREDTSPNRVVSERSWSGGSSGDTAAVLRSRSGGGVGRKLESGWELARRRLLGDMERQRHEWRGYGSSSRRGAVCLSEVDVGQPTTEVSRHSRRSWREVTPLPSIAGVAGANRAAR